MHADGALINGVLKDGMGFDGFVISDWQAHRPDPRRLRRRDVRTSINAGLDMIDGAEQLQAFNTALDGRGDGGPRPAGAGRRRGPPHPDPEVRARPVRAAVRGPLARRPTSARAEHRAVARKAAAKSQVLLKNAGRRAAAAKTAKVYVAGSNADDIGNQTGGWTVTWQGGSGDITDRARRSCEGIAGRADARRSTYSQGRLGPDGGLRRRRRGRRRDAVRRGRRRRRQRRDDLAAVARPTGPRSTRVCGAMKCAVLVVSGPPAARSATSSARSTRWSPPGCPAPRATGVADVLFGNAAVHRPAARSPGRSRGASCRSTSATTTYDPQFPYGWGLTTRTKVPQGGEKTLKALAAARRCARGRTTTKAGRALVTRPG